MSWSVNFPTGCRLAEACFIFTSLRWRCSIFGWESRSGNMLQFEGRHLVGAVADADSQDSAFVAKGQAPTKE